MARGSLVLTYRRPMKHISKHIQRDVQGWPPGQFLNCSGDGALPSTRRAVKDYRERFHFPFG
jgi:hypothetical protein